MKTMNKYIVATLITSAVAGGAIAAQASEAKTNDALGAAKSAVTMNYAVDLALQKVPGTAVSANYEDEDGKAVWEVEVVATNSEVHDLKIDASSGDVLKHRLDHADHESEDNDD